MIMLLVVSSLFSGVLAAQEESYDEADTDAAEYTAAPPVNDKLDKIAARLQLTEDQRLQVATILEEFSQQGAPASPEDKKSRRRALRARVMALLTPEQKARARQKRSSGNAQRTPAANEKARRSWFDVLLDDVAMPLLNHRQRRRSGPNN